MSSGLRCLAGLYLLLLSASSSQDACSVSLGKEKFHDKGSDPTNDCKTADAEAHCQPYYSYNFSQGPNGFKQGCLQMALEWRHEQGYWQMKANFIGYFGTFSALESPSLDIAVPSCLKFRALCRLPAKLDVVFDTGNLYVETIPPVTDGVTHYYALNIPSAVTKVIFRGMHGGDSIGYVRIYAVWITAGSCSGQENSQDNPASPTCGNERANEGTNVGAVAGGVIGVVLVIVIIVGMVIYWKRKKQRSPSESRKPAAKIDLGAAEPKDTEKGKEACLTNNYCEVRDAVLCEPSLADDGYCIAQVDPYATPYHTIGDPNHRSSNQYNHLGQKGDKTQGENNSQNDYNHIVSEMSSAGGTIRNLHKESGSAGDQLPNEYHEVSISDDSQPEELTKGTENSFGEYNMLETNNPRGKDLCIREGTLNAYGHLKGLPTDENDYDLAQRDRAIKIIDSDYNHLNKT